VPNQAAGADQQAGRRLRVHPDACLRLSRLLILQGRSLCMLMMQLLCLLTLPLRFLLLFALLLLLLPLLPHCVQPLPHLLLPLRSGRLPLRRRAAAAAGRHRSRLKFCCLRSLQGAAAALAQQDVQHLPRLQLRTACGATAGGVKRRRRRL